jgi:formylglycine-generating enzyme required for sulfatase activity
MDSVIEALVKLIPCSELLENIGLNRETALAIATVVEAILIFLLWKGSEKLTNRLKDCKAANDLAPWFDYLKVKKSRELFIPTTFQNISPTRENEPGFSSQYVAKKPLVDFFIKTAFNKKKDTDKYYLILADSGMGKTTFMINLYLRYTSFLNFRKEYKIKLFPFGDSRILDRIREIDKEEITRTVLLLDAFDEDKGLLPPAEPDGLSDDDRFRRRLDEIIETVRDFREVIITSRTQYFPGQEDQSYELNVPRFDDKGFHRLAKFYISPFEDREIQKYLNRKYGIVRYWNKRKKQNALSVVKKAPQLMVRPMLLSYIDYFTDANSEYHNTWQVYEALIQKWIEREANKRKYKTSEHEKFKADLYEYSRLVAIEIFVKRKDNDMLSLDKNTAVKVAEENGLDLRDYEITGQSLLTKDVLGNWKFAHKSILEYFIAKETLKNESFYSKAYFAGMDMVLQFVDEANSDFVFIKGGKFKMGSPLNEVGKKSSETQHEVTVGDFYMLKFPVTIELFEMFVLDSKYEIDKGWKQWIKKPGEEYKRYPVVNVSWDDACAYCKWLSKKRNGLFRLPTEAEWEYACRAGSSSSFCFGDNEKKLEEYAWYAANSGGSFQPVCKKKPNNFGLYDMHGSVWEWCSDWYGDYSPGPATNPKGPKIGSGRVLRGGSWFCDSRDCRCACRTFSHPGYRNGNFGFRVVFLP